MKYEDIGNTNDYCKYALLRILSAHGLNRIGVCSMFAKEGRRDPARVAGRPRLSQQFRGEDPELFGLMQSINGHSAFDRLRTIRSAEPIPGACYFDDELPNDELNRFSFIRRARHALGQTDLVFFDPDKGMEQSLPRGRTGSNRYVYLDELSLVFGSGKSLMVYQHYNREDRRSFISERVTRLQDAARDASIWRFTAPKYMFLIALHPDSPACLHMATKLASVSWPADFIRGELAVEAIVSPAVRVGA